MELPLKIAFPTLKIPSGGLQIRSGAEALQRVILQPLCSKNFNFFLKMEGMWAEAGLALKIGLLCLCDCVCVSVCLSVFASLKIAFHNAQNSFPQLSK